MQSLSNDDAVPIRWQCPLAVESRIYTTKSDIYSFGVLMWEIYNAGATPFGGLLASEVLLKAKRGHRLRWVGASNYAPEEIKILVQSCTSMNPQERPTISWLTKRLKSLRDGDQEGGDGERVKMSEAVVLSISDELMKREDAKMDEVVESDMEESSL